MVIRKDFHCIKRGDSVGEAIRQFKIHPVKRLIVVNERNQVCGILTLGRLLRWFAERLLTQNASGV
jgi:predicted transcriptional regulator